MHLFKIFFAFIYVRDILLITQIESNLVTTCFNCSEKQKYPLSLHHFFCQDLSKLKCLSIPIWRLSWSDLAWGYAVKEQLVSIMLAQLFPSQTDCLRPSHLFQHWVWCYSHVGTSFFILTSHFGCCTCVFTVLHCRVSHTWHQSPLKEHKLAPILVLKPPTSPQWGASIWGVKQAVTPEYWGPNLTFHNCWAPTTLSQENYLLLLVTTVWLS